MQLLRWANHLLEFCYPGVCAGCDGSCDGTSSVCDSCLDSLKKLESAAACEWCAMPLAQSGAPCPYCQGKGVPHYERIARLGVFDDPLKAIIHQIKYHNRWSLAGYLAERAWAHPPVRRLLEQSDRIVAVPLHPLREILRGYDQAHLIARRLARLSRLKLVRPILRIRNTPTQTRLHSRSKRDENLRHAFALSNPRCIRGRRVVVVDDVATSGATLQSVARALKEARPQSLCGIVLAIADPKHYDFQVV